MMPNDFVITEFSNIYEASNAKGKILELKNRYCSCFIVGGLQTLPGVVFILIFVFTKSHIILRLT